MIEARGVFQYRRVATRTHVTQDALHGGEDLVVGNGFPFQQGFQAGLEVSFKSRESLNIHSLFFGHRGHREHGGGLK